MQHWQDSRTIDLERGLFVVRYTAAQDVQDPPIIHLTSDAPRGAPPRFILHPDARQAALSGPGASAVVLSEAPGRLVMSVAPGRLQGSIACKITVESLTPGRERIGGASPQGSLRAGGLEILGHVAGRGDVRVGPDEWLGGPKMPARIEGLKIDWADRPEAVELTYAALTAGADASRSRMNGLGAFVGSRGRAMPIVGLELALTGPAASRVSLSAEALFLGAPVLRLSGQRIKASGPTGREPLVGIKLNLDPVTSAVGRVPQDRTLTPVAPAGAVREVRIFRADEHALSPAG